MSALLFATVVPYLVPTGIAAYRDHPEKNAIFLLNLLLGWTILGWIAALIWACAGPAQVQQVGATGDELRPGGLLLQGRDPRVDTYGNPKSADFKSSRPG